MHNPIKPSAQKTNFSSYASLYYLVLSILCAAIFLKNYWIAEDAYINFRSLDQLWLGRGPIWNPDERVQVYTSPLWYWLIAAVRCLIHDLYWDTFTCSFVLYLLTIGIMLQRQRGGVIAKTAIILLLLASNSFMDYTASGLENVLLYFLLTGFFFWLVSRPDTGTDGYVPYLWGSMIMLVRHDELVLLLPFLMATAWQEVKEHGWRHTVISGVIGMLPLLLWTLFSFIYYGFPFPNTAYAKLNTSIPESEMLLQGWRYLEDTIIYFDPLLPVIIIIGMLAGFAIARTRALAAGILLNLAYVVYVGGDYMWGRFLCHLYLLSVLIFFHWLQQAPTKAKTVVPWMAILFCIVWTFTARLSPALTGPDFIDRRDYDGTGNERGQFYPCTSLRTFIAAKANGQPFPNWPFYTEGLALKKSGARWVVFGNIGMYGYGAGVDVHIFDRLALSDPLLARLPALAGPWSPGHFARNMPWGYVDASLDGPASSIHIYDDDLAKYYQILRIITKSPDLFTVERFKAIWYANFDPAFGELRTSHIERWSERGCKICKDEFLTPEQRAKKHGKSSQSLDLN